MRQIKTQWLLEAMINGDMKNIGFVVQCSTKVEKNSLFTDEDIEKLLLSLIEMGQINTVNAFNEDVIRNLTENFLIGLGYDMDEDNFDELMNEIEIIPVYL